MTVLSAGSAPVAAGAAANIESARVKEIAALLPAKPAGIGRPVTDRARWEKLARAPGFAAVVADAENLAKKATPPLPDDLVLDYSRTGNRDRCQHVMSALQGSWRYLFTSATLLIQKPHAASCLVPSSQT